MALLWVDGFDGYGTGTSLVPGYILAGRYSGFNMATGLTDPRVLGNGRSIRTNGAWFWISTPKLTENRTLIVGFGFALSATGSNARVLEWFNGANIGLYCVLRGGHGELDFYRESANYLGTTSGARLTNERWSYIEIKVYCDSSAGTIDVKVDGVSCLSLSGINTQGTSSNYYDRIRLLDVGTNYEHSIDDLYICDGSGSVNNDFLGPCKVMVVKPSADVVGETDWTPSAGTDHYALVDETEMNEDTDYVESDIIDDQDLWEYENTPTEIGTIRGIQICTDCRLTDVEQFDLKIPAKLSTTYSEGSAQSTGSIEYNSLLRVMDADPDGNPWTASNLDSSQFGVKVA